MTLGLIIGILVLAVFIVFGTDWTDFDIAELVQNAVLGLFLGCIIWGAVSLIGGVIVLGIYNDDAFNLVSEEKIELVGVKATVEGKYGNPAILGTDTNMNTNTYSMNRITIVDEECEPYITKYTYYLKCQFISHAFNKTEYEFHGSVKELYKE